MSKLDLYQQNEILKYSYESLSRQIQKLGKQIDIRHEDIGSIELDNSLDIEEEEAKNMDSQNNVNLKQTRLLDELACTYRDFVSNFQYESKQLHQDLDKIQNLVSESSEQRRTSIKKIETVANEFMDNFNKMKDSFDTLEIEISDLDTA